MKKRKVRTHKFRGKVWRIRRIPPDHPKHAEDIDPPDTRGKILRIPFGDSRADLDAQIHGALHACFWDIEEAAINDAATDIAKYLRRLGWRKQV